MVLRVQIRLVGQEKWSSARDLVLFCFFATTMSEAETSTSQGPITPRASQKRSSSGELRGRWSHRTHQLCCNQPTTVERRSGGSFVDLAARPEGGVGDALRPLGVTFMPPSPVLAGAAPREAREKAAIGRRVRLAPLRPSSIRGAHGHHRRHAEAIELPSNSWAPIDGRSGRVQEERSLVHLVEILTNWMISPNTSSSTTSIRDPFALRRSY